MPLTLGGMLMYTKGYNGVRGDEMIDGKLWRETCATDERLALASAAEVSFTACGADFVFGAGSGGPAFELRAPDAAWQRFFQRVPPPWYQSFFGMLMRVPGTEIRG